MALFFGGNFTFNKCVLVNKVNHGRALLKNGVFLLPCQFIYSLMPFVITITTNLAPALKYSKKPIHK